LLGARMIGTDGQQSGSDGPVSIVAISADGALATLESNIVGSPSVIGRDDGQAWAWAEQTNSPNCGSSVGAALDVYIDEGSGAHMLARVSFGADVTEASLAAWTAAGIVVSGDNECGALGASTLATSPAILINPATGAATGLAGRIGTDCSFQDIADDGTIACSLGGASPGIRFIAPDRMQTEYSIPGMTSPRALTAAWRYPPMPCTRRSPSLAPQRRLGPNSFCSTERAAIPWSSPVTTTWPQRSGRRKTS